MSMRGARVRSWVCVGATVTFSFAGPLVWDGRLVSLHEPAQRPATRVINVGRAYGTLEFRGQIERLENGDEYEFRPRITVTFRADAAENRPDIPGLIELRLSQLVATIARPGERADILHRDVQAISVVLSGDGDAEMLPALLFRLPKKIAEAANHVGLGVSDGRLLWPIAVELK
jgi:hypothetical protein